MPECKISDRTKCSLFSVTKSIYKVKQQRRDHNCHLIKAHILQHTNEPLNGVGLLFFQNIILLSNVISANVNISL